MEVPLSEIPKNIETFMWHLKLSSMVCKIDPPLLRSQNEIFFISIFGEAELFALCEYTKTGGFGFYIDDVRLGFLDPTLQFFDPKLAAEFISNKWFDSFFEEH